MNIFRRFSSNIIKDHHPRSGMRDLLRYIGPGLLVTVGFIDPGNWAVNLEAGSTFGYTLLWVITLSSAMLIVIQHNAAHLGIVTGLCISEAATRYMPRWVSRPILGSAMLASISTSLAEILGGAIALQMLFDIPIRVGSVMMLIICIVMLFSNSYRKIEKWIIAFVSLIGISFLYELWLVDVNWAEAAVGWVVPTMPDGSALIIVSVLGAVVMPHNLFLHSEVIQSRQWNLEDEKVIRKQLRYEYLDTIFSMIIGWAINSAMIILAASVFFAHGTPVVALEQARAMLEPLVGSNAGVIFAIALLLAGICSTITSSIAGASIFAGAFSEPFQIKDLHSKIGALISLVIATLLIFLISNPFRGLVLSQAFLSLQLPITIFTQLWLTSSAKIMGHHKNSTSTNTILIFLGSLVTALNFYLLYTLI